MHVPSPRFAGLKLIAVLIAIVAFIGLILIMAPASAIK
jgi:hypothetical protein